MHKGSRVGCQCILDTTNAIWQGLFGNFNVLLWRRFGWIGLSSATSPVAWLDFGMLLPFAGFPLGFPHCVKKGQP